MLLHPTTRRSIEQALADAFTVDELRSLAVAIQPDVLDLLQASIADEPAAARELVSACERRDCLPDLLTQAVARRPEDALLRRLNERLDSLHDAQAHSERSSQGYVVEKMQNEQQYGGLRFATGAHINGPVAGGDMTFFMPVFGQLPSDGSAILIEPIHPGLPPDTQFVGRSAETQCLIEALSAVGSKTILCYGPGGCGKTALAAHVARRMIGGPFERICWSSAAGMPGWGLTHLLRDLAEVLPNVGKRADIEEQRTEALKQLRINPTLLICDYLDALDGNPDEQNRVAEFLRNVDARHGTRILLTARQHEEWLRELTSAADGAEQLLEGLQEDDAVELIRLLAQRKNIRLLASGSDADFAELAKAVFYNPKLIELLVGLGDYAVIRRVKEELPPRLSTARNALLAEAFSQLDKTPGAMTLLQAVTVFLPSADLPAIEFVCKPALPEGSDFIAALDTAHSAALLSSVTTEDGVTRYHASPLVEGYMIDNNFQLEEYLSSGIMTLWSVYYAQFCWEHADVTISENRKVLAAEWENLNAGWRWMNEVRIEAHSAGAEAGADMAETARLSARGVAVYGIGLYYFLWWRGLWSLAHELLQEAIEAAKQIDDDANEALTTLLSMLAAHYRMEGKLEEAARVDGQSLAVLQNGAEWSNVKMALQTQSAPPASNASAQALSELNLELQSAQQSGDTSSEILIRSRLASLHTRATEYELAREHFATARQLAKNTGDLLGELQLLEELILFAQETRDWDEGVLYCHEALKVAQQLDAPLFLSTAHVVIGSFLFWSGDLTTAVYSLRKVLEWDDRFQSDTKPKPLPGNRASANLALGFYGELVKMLGKASHILLTASIPEKSKRQSAHLFMQLLVQQISYLFEGIDPQRFFRGLMQSVYPKGDEQATLWEDAIVHTAHTALATPAAVEWPQGFPAEVNDALLQASLEFYSAMREFAIAFQAAYADPRGKAPISENAAPSNGSQAQP